MTQKNATVEVPAVLKECLLSLTEVRAKIEDYAPKSNVSDSVTDYALKIDDLIDDAGYQVTEMMRTEIINLYHFKNQ